MTNVPWMETPAGPMSTKSPPTFRLICMPASMMRLRPGLQVDRLSGFECVVLTDFLLLVPADHQALAPVDGLHATALDVKVLVLFDESLPGSLHDGLKCLLASVGSVPTVRNMDPPTVCGARLLLWRANMSLNDYLVM